jgi:quercetin dioxygenase-like cupin family protein
LALATGVALFGVGATLTDAQLAPPPAGASAANAELVGAFYDAVNEAIRSGHTDRIDALVAPDVAWCRGCADQMQSRAGLEHYLLALHRTTPAARLIVDEVVADGNETAMARVHVAGLPTIGTTAPWGPIDSFRIAGGQIVERGNVPDSVGLREALVRVRFDSLPPAVTGIAMARLTFLLGSGVDGLLSAGPTLLVVEAGSLTVNTAGGGRVLRANGSDEETGKGAAMAALLHQGDSAIVPAGVRHSLAQAGTEPAVVLGVTLYYVDDGSGPHQRRGPELGLFTPLDQINRDSRQSGPLPDVRFLASGAVEAWPAGPVEVALGRAVLGAGGQLSSTAEEEMLLAVESGTLELNGGEKQRVVAGTGVVQAAGPDHEFRNAGGGLLSLLVLSVAPEAN